ncbi:ribose-phosphate pyrophosphokinase [Candidatus Gottesmanbacteria bacterium]|nr:ribose-phosphate pyrophosphokinase [Candidatus Gottesmanbacteria bacterium]
MKILAGSTNQAFARNLANRLQIPMISREIVTFADGETRVRIGDSVQDEQVIFVQSLAGLVNDYLIETLLLIDALKDHGVKEVIGVFPYLAYARQNKAHRPGEGVSAQTVAKLLEQVGVSKLITYDIHALNALSYFSIPTINTSVLPVLMQKLIVHVGDEQRNSLVVVAPDQDGTKRAKDAADKLGLPHAFVEKERDLETVDTLKEIHGQKVVGEVAGKIAILADDIISTGNTLVQAGRHLKETGVEKVYAAVTHGLFSKGFDNLVKQKDIEKIYISDSVYHPNLPPQIEVVSTIDTAASILQQNVG